MKIRSLALAAAMLAAFTSAATTAYAQTKIFVIDEATIRAGSKIGVDIQSKLGAIEKEGVDKLGLQTLADQIKSEEAALQPQLQTMVDAEGRIALESLNSNPTLKSRVEALSQKQNELAQKSNLLNQNLNQQSNAAVAAFSAALAPAVQYVGKQEGADVILSSSSTWYVNNAVDLSAKVIQRLDATTPTLASLEGALKPPAQ